MRLVVDMPYAKNLSVNHCRMGPRGNWHIKPDVEDWMDNLQWVIILERVKQTQEGRCPPHISLPLHVKVEFRFPDKRKRDDHNYYYVLANAIAAAFAIDDEELHISTGNITRGVGKEAAGFTIEVSDEPPD